MIFRKLNEQEKQEFKQWARDHYEPFSEILGIWHPITQAECVQINVENSTFAEQETCQHEHGSRGGICEDCGEEI